MKTMPLLLLALAVAARAAAAAPAAPPGAKSTDLTALFGDSVVAKGKGVEVKRSQIDAEVIRYKSQAAGKGQVISPDQTLQLEKDVLRQMINIQLLLAKATEADKAAGKASAQKRMQEARERLGSEEALDRELKLIGATREEIVSKWAEGATAEEVVKRELKLHVTEDDLKKAYEENRAKFEQPEMVRASHILFGTRDMQNNTELPDDKKAAKRKQAEAVLKRARAGEDFAKLAKEFSEDPGSKDKGGEYTFPRNQMVKEFETAAFALSTNQISEIVTTQFGYHIIKLSEKYPARTATLDDEVVFAPAGYVVMKKHWTGAPEAMRAATKVSARLRQKTEGEQLQQQFPDYIEKLKQAAGLEILDEKLKPKEGENLLGLPAGHPAVKPQTNAQSK